MMWKDFFLKKKNQKTNHMTSFNTTPQLLQTNKKFQNNDWNGKWNLNSIEIEEGGGKNKKKKNQEKNSIFFPTCLQTSKFNSQKLNLDASYYYMIIIIIHTILKEKIFNVFYTVNNFFKK